MGSAILRPNNRIKRPRLYADTSVFGGYFDKEFAEVSGKLFQEIREGKFILVISETTFTELENAPLEVRQLLDKVPQACIETIELSEEIEDLRDSYLEAGVVGSSSSRDAEHIACASVARADLIVSWNFKHIVNFQRIRGYHAVNLLKGYFPIPIYSPMEVVSP
ncbi:MAG TPA: PIN domain-containing protein [bacterium]|nr:PIN domain-containing protein [bacterium]